MVSKVTGMHRIAVIEDSSDVLVLVCEEPRQMACQVRTATDGWLGLELCLSWRPDVVVPDVMLPSLNGIEVLRCQAFQPA
jgi:DNA-binding response OmpR family regulator